MAALRDDDPDVRAAARQVIATHPRADAVPALLDTIDDDCEPRRDSILRRWEWRTTPAEALAAIGDPRAIKPLIAQVRDRRPGPRPWWYAIDALGDLKATEAADTLRPLTEHHDASVRDSAAEALRKIGFADEFAPGRYGPERWKRLVKRTFAASAVPAVAIWLWWAHPVFADHWGRPGWETLWWLGLIYAPLVLLYWWLDDEDLLERVNGRLRVTLAAALPVAATIAVAVIASPNHPLYDEAGRVYAAYTHRFPDGKLYDPYIRERDGTQFTVCSPARRWRGDEFCVEIDTSAPRGAQVSDSYRWQPPTEE